tara:strand:- start:55 stop:282 length:228 start_codon:yes stop_codon:yes gene_type:complete
MSDDWNGRVWWLQLMVVLAWAALIGVLWLSWTGAVLQDMPAGDGGLAAVLTTGCCGFSWVVGLVPIVLVFAVLRR